MSATETKFQFTMARLRDLPVPTSGRATYYDLKQPGLAFVVTAKNHRSFYFRKWAAGSVKNIHLGPFPGLHLDDARNDAAKKMGTLASGGQVISERAKRANNLTLGQLWGHYDTLWLARKKRETQRTNRDRYNATLKRWESRLVAGITRRDVVELHAEIGKDRQTQANRAVQLLREVCNFGIHELSLNMTNPATGIHLFPERSRERFLTAEEMPRFFASLATETVESGSSNWSDFFLTCLFTGARRNNVQIMRWENLDLDAQIWTIPGEEFKTGKAKQIVLPKDAVEILRRRRENFGEACGWVFPANSASGHVTEPKTAWTRICHRAGISGLRIHDLRRSLGSWQAGLGASLPIIGKSLGHDRAESTQVYARLDMRPVLESVEAAVRAIREAGQVAEDHPAQE